MDRRIEKTLKNAKESALQVLAEGGYASFTMEAVAEHSGIAKSTLYRHWEGRLELLSDALETLNRQPPQRQPLRKGEVRQRVLELIEHLAAVFESSRIAAVMPALIEAAEHHPRVASFLHGYSAARRRTLVETLREAAELEDLPPRTDPELAALVLSGPIFYCRMMTPEPFPVRRVAELVDSVLGTQPPVRRRHKRR